MKYDRKKIMKRAWQLKKGMNIELGQAIKISWNIEKKELKEIEEAKHVHTQITYKEAINNLGLKYSFNYVA